MISARFALPVAVLLALALVPTIIHSYRAATVNDLLVTEAIDSRIGNYNSAATQRKTAYIKDTFGSDDWIERIYTGPDGDSILLFVARSFDLKRLYHHPELGILYGVDLAGKAIINLGENDELPVHPFNSRTGRGAAGYVLLYEGRFIRNPLKQQLLSSIEQLFAPRKAMTLFFVYDSEMPASANIESSNAAMLLEQAIKSFRTQRQ